MKNGRVTIKEIAKIAKVSRGTVDRVLNNRGRVNQEKKALILEIADQLGYQKNMIARNLSLNKNSKIHVVIPAHKNDAYWQMVFQGLNSSSSLLNQFNIGISFFQFDISSPKDYIKKLKQAYKELPDFIIFAPVFTEETLRFLDRNDQVKFFAINSEIEHKAIISFLGQNSYSAGMIAGRLFQKQIQKKKISIICLTLGHLHDNAIHILKKLEGLQDFENQQKTTFNIISVTIEDFQDLQKIKKACRKMEKTYPDIDGIFLMNSRSKPFIENSGYTSKKDKEIPIIGFDLTDENITFLNQSKIDFLLNERPFEQGEKSVKYLFESIIYNQIIPPKVYLPVDIIIKENYELFLPSTMLQKQGRSFVND